jgi:5-amino-6-(5-phosphoribosylamino)uracil reductase
VNRPHVLLSVATSLDGHIDDASPERLILSGAEDLDRVDAERAAADAILVGAATIAADDPRLLVRSAARRAERVARGLPPSPIKVAITRSGRGLDPSAKFFTTGDGEKLVYALVAAPMTIPAAAPATSAAATSVAPGATSVAPAAPVAPAAAPVAPTAAPAVSDLQRRLAGLATVVIAPDLPAVLADLAARGVARLMVEGGTRTTTAFLTAGLVDELQVVVAPLVVGDPAAPRLAAAAVDRMELVDLRQVGDCALLVYRPRQA